MNYIPLHNGNNFNNEDERVVKLIRYTFIAILLLLIIIHFSGCRNVQNIHSFEKQKTDSVYAKSNDSLQIQLLTQKISVLDLKDFDITINYDTTKPQRAVASSFIESLVQLGTVKNIHLSAKELTDSTYNKNQTVVTDTKSNQSGEVNKTVIQKDEKKDVKSGTNLGIIGAVLLVIIIILMWVGNKSDTIFKPVEEIEKMI